MTQPTTLATSFDTSLVDVQKSFSSTETNTSVSSAGKENMPPSEAASQGQDQQPARHGSPFKEVSNLELYEKWADTYDHDGNILQFVDDLQMVSLLDQFVDLTTKGRGPQDSLALLDLGCGTGRNTVKLSQAPWNSNASLDFHAWDSSKAMLDVAKLKLSSNTGHNVNLEVVDISKLDNIPTRYNGFFDGLVSTLVLEHIEIKTYFSAIANLLRPRGFAVVTSMHDEMGRLSRAGFKSASGERFKGMSFVYTVAETVEAAQAAGLEVVGDVGETAVDERMIDGGVLENGVRVEKGAVAERARKWVGTKVWVGMILRKK